MSRSLAIFGPRPRPRGDSPALALFRRLPPARQQQLRMAADLDHVSIEERIEARIEHVRDQIRRGVIRRAPL